MAAASVLAILLSVAIWWFTGGRVAFLLLPLLLGLPLLRSKDRED